MSYSTSNIHGITAEEIAALKRVSIRTTDRLLDNAASVKRRHHLAGRTGIVPSRLLDLANNADLMQIRGMSKGYVALVRLAGVLTIKELGHRNAGKLHDAMARVNFNGGGEKVVDLLPSPPTIQRWIEQAKGMSIRISY